LTACPLCKGPEGVEVWAASYDRSDSRVKCVRCGTFDVDGMAWRLYENHHAPGWEQNRHLLSGRARNATLEGRVEAFHLDDFGDAEHGKLREPDVDEKMRLILAWFQGRSTRFGEILRQVSETDYPVAYCSDPKEWMALIYAMVEEKWLSTDHTGYGVRLAGRKKLQADKAVA
jgi:hypothetical protein